MNRKIHFLLLLILSFNIGLLSADTNRRDIGPSEFLDVIEEPQPARQAPPETSSIDSPTGSAVQWGSESDSFNVQTSRAVDEPVVTEEPVVTQRVIPEPQPAIQQPPEGSAVTFDEPVSTFTTSTSEAPADDTPVATDDPAPAVQTSSEGSAVVFDEPVSTFTTSTSDVPVDEVSAVADTAPAATEPTPVAADTDPGRTVSFDTDPSFDTTTASQDDIAAEEEPAGPIQKIQATIRKNCDRLKDAGPMIQSSCVIIFSTFVYILAL